MLILARMALSIADTLLVKFINGRVHLARYVESREIPVRELLMSKENA